MGKDTETVDDTTVSLLVHQYRLLGLEGDQISSLVHDDGMNGNDFDTYIRSPIVTVDEIYEAVQEGLAKDEEVSGIKGKVIFKLRVKLMRNVYVLNPVPRFRVHGTHLT